MNSVRRNAAWGAAGAMSVGLVLSGLMGAPASSVGFADGSYPPTPPPTSTPPTSPPPTSPPPTSPPPTSASPTTSPTTPTPPPRQPLPLIVKANNKKKTYSNKFVTLVRSSRTNNQGVVKRRVTCRPLKPTAAGEVSFCRVVITRNGGVKVKVQGYGKVKVTVQMTARPKAAFREDWRPTRYRKTWTLRGDTRRASSFSAGDDVSLRIGVAA